MTSGSIRAKKKSLRDASTSPSTISTRRTSAAPTETRVERLIDFIRAALGRLRIKSREEKIEETFRAWLVSRSLAPNQAAYLSLLENRGIATGRVRLDDLFEPPLSILDAAGKGIELFGEQGLREVVDDLNAGVFDLAG